MPTAFDVQIEEPGEGVAVGQIAVRTRATTVTAGERSLHYIDRSDRVVVLDFVQRRLLRIHIASSTYSDQSLFAIIGLRHFELLSRGHIRAVVEAGGGDGSIFSPVLVEHQLAVRDSARSTTITESRATRGKSHAPGALRSLFQRKPSVDIAVETVGSNVVFVAAKHRLLSYAGQGFDSPGAPPAFAQFLRYAYGGHPLILERVAALGFIPNELRIHGLEPKGFDRGDVACRPLSPRQVEGDPPPTAGFEQVLGFSDAEPADLVLDFAKLRMHRARAQPQEQRLAAAISLLKSGAGLEGLLSFFELNLEIDVAMPPELSDAIRSCSDSRVTAFLATLSPSSDAESVRVALQRQTELRATVADPCPVMDVFEAELRTAIGERDTAKQLLVRALRTNGRLAGAYKTLGDIYLSAYDANRAWRCWDMARALAPSHAVLKPVTALEQMLLTEHPEYFA